MSSLTELLKDLFVFVVKTGLIWGSILEEEIELILFYITQLRNIIFEYHLLAMFTSQKTFSGTPLLTIKVKLFQI